MIAMTSMVGGGWLVVFGSSGSPWAGAAAVVVGPAILYLCYHLVLRTRWAWSAVLVLVALLLLSSLIRLAVTPELQVAVVAEIAVELALGYYLTRPGIREAFGWSATEGA
jgi:hypothetical protein